MDSTEESLNPIRVTTKDSEIGRVEMKINRTGLFLAAALLAQSQSSVAAAEDTKTSAPADIVSAAPLSSEPKPEDKKVSGFLKLSRTNSAILKDTNSTVASWDYAGNLTYKFSGLWKVSTTLEGSRDLKNPETSDLSKGVVKTIYSGVTAKEAPVAIVPSFSVGAPVSRAQNSATFRGSTGMGLLFTLNSDILFSKKLGVAASLTGSRSYHKFETGENGIQNIQYGSAQILYLSWDFTDNLGVSIELDHLNYWNYVGTLTEYYAHAEELGYKFTENWAVALGHQYGNPFVAIRKPNGQEYNFNVIDGDNSMTYVQLSYTF